MSSTDIKEIKIFIGSWNVNGKSIWKEEVENSGATNNNWMKGCFPGALNGDFKNPLKEWLASGFLEKPPDIYAIGFQEMDLR